MYHKSFGDLRKSNLKVLPGFFIDKSKTSTKS